MKSQFYRARLLTLGLLTFFGQLTALADTPVRSPAPFVLDMAGHNPGEKPAESAFRDPQRLADWGYTGQVIDSVIEGIATFDSISPTLMLKGTRERSWANTQTAIIAEQIRAAHAAGIKCYAWMQVLVLPKSLVANLKDQICDSHGRIDVHLPRTQELFRAQLREIFHRLPDLDGLVIRTGEIYLQDLPFHVASGNGDDSQIQANTAILHGHRVISTC